MRSWVENAGPTIASAPSRKSGVRPDHQAPRVRGGPATVDREVDQRWYHGAGDTGECRDHRAPAVGELANRELATYLQADHEEEQDHESVVEPVLEVH